MPRRLTILALLLLILAAAPLRAETAKEWLQWKPLPSLPDPIGVAGPVVGVHHDALIVGGGANFPVAPGEDLWQASKQWHAAAWVLVRDDAATDAAGYRWIDGFKLDRPVGYSACASVPQGVVAIGGCDAENIFADCFLLTWDPEEKQLQQTALPALPEPCSYGAATAIGSRVYVAGGQTGADLATATNHFWTLELANRDKGPNQFRWQRLPSWPGPSRAFAVAVAQHNGYADCIYLIGGRRQKEGTEGVDGVEPLSDVYEFCPTWFDPTAYDAKTDQYAGEGRFAQPWRKRTPAPTPIMAGTAVAVGQAHVMVLSGADGSLMRKADELKDAHPGFPKRSWAYHTITDTWTDAGPTPANQVTTPAVAWGDRYVLVSGEVRPRVRTPAAWLVEPVRKAAVFGPVNTAVLAGYLLAMVGVGVYFTSRNKDTNDYFRGGQRIPWWVAGCSIFATMLSSITFMAVPAKAFAQDWVFVVGNFMIVAVAPLAIYVALPFFRRIDATSAYEYLQKRFAMPVRLFASASFTVFHIFRMGIVMSLAALALAAVAPLTPVQSVLVMGLLSVLYCTLGGVEAVVWTDTIQTFVLLGGALLCLILLLAAGGDAAGGTTAGAFAAGKLRMANLHWDSTGVMTALWVVVIGGLGQNISSYTADQAVVQRYMTTPDQRRAARAIWTNAVLTIPATFLFFGLGTALWRFYGAHPEKLDPTFTTDQIFPLFISHEVPIGVAGLIVAGIFAAAQSTISTSMNSTATTVVTDFLRPFNVFRSERAYLNVARVLTLLLGLLGTGLGLAFVNPNIKSLFDTFIMVIGLFMGVLGGLFCLGMFTRRTSAVGAMAGAIGGATTMFAVGRFTAINGYCYAAIGVASCFVIGYLVSLLAPAPRHDIAGLTVYDLRGS